MPTNRAASLLESCSKCGNHDKHSANRVVSNQLDHSRPAPEKSSPREMYILPTKQEALFLFGTFFRDIGTLFPYINEVDILDQYQKSRMQQPPKFRAVFLALLNIIWAHACASQSKVQRETFYNRAVALLDLRTLERPGYELGKFISFVLLFSRVPKLINFCNRLSSANAAVDGHVQAKSSEINIQLYHTCIVCQSRISCWPSLGASFDGLRDGRTTQTC